MATTFAQRSKALNLWSPDEAERFKLSTVDNGWGREASIDYKDGAGNVLFPGTLVYVHQGIRYALGDTIASEVARAQGAETAIQAALDVETSHRIANVSNLQAVLTYETTERVANVVAINEKTAYLEDRANILSQQHESQATSINTEVTRATGVEASLQTQISALLSNTDAVALNSLAELVTDYRQNGSTVAASVAAYQTSNDAAIAAYQTSNDAALAAALARINLLETFIVSLQDTTAGGGD